MGGGMLQDPGNLRSDTLDVKHYFIDLNMTQIATHTISGSCEIVLMSLMDNVDRVTLDLAALTVDSVEIGAVNIAFSHIGDKLTIVLPQSLQTSDEVMLKVSYHGVPVQDTSWGGFYFNSSYAFNLGVAFDAEPHNFGRTWFPCFDNFVERSKFDFHVLTNSGKTAYCNGMRQSVEVVGTDSLLTHWSIQEEIPTYLACVAVGNYTEAISSFPSTQGFDIPIYLIAQANDTTDMKNSMVNLSNCLMGFENRFGPYLWPKVGYCAVPFNGGAMEHATCISYPLFAVDGTLAYETLYAHELSHHWFGDLVTCRNAEDMWLNEGWASYCEAIFLENLYGQNEFINHVRDNHKDVLFNAHIDDGGRYPVSGVPSQITYGSHVYNKGADVAHSLRGYMGDAAFFEGLRYYLDTYSYNDVSSLDLRDAMQLYTSADLDSFFENWVFNEGFTECRVDHLVVTGNSAQIEISQHGHYAPGLYTNLPLTLTLLDGNGSTTMYNVVVSGSALSETLTLPDGFIPVAAFLNEDDAVSLAVLGEERIISSIGTNDFGFAEMDIDINNLGGNDSLFLRIENHFALADPTGSTPEYYISADRWWNVIFPDNPDIAIDATIRYYGNPTGSKYLDPLFFQYLQDNNLTEESMLLFYRPDGLSQWQIWGDYNLVTPPGATNWLGRIDINGVRPGQYAWGVPMGNILVAETISGQVSINRVSEGISITNGNSRGRVEVFSAAGQLVASGDVVNQKIIPTAPFSPGIYTVRYFESSKQIAVKRVVVD
jgi:aminopeptidase N